MINDRKQALLSEKKQVAGLLASIPSDRVIDRLSFEVRLKELERELSTISEPSHLIEKLSLTFRGAPVRDSQAISADFAGEAMSAFADAIAALVAGVKGKLKGAGPIPDRNSTPLMITGMATGSYGFEMELPSVGESLPLLKTDQIDSEDEVGPAFAIDIFRELLCVSAQGDDENISDLVEKVHPRAVKKVADFLSFLDKREAWCGLEFRGKNFRFKDLDQLKRTGERLTDSHIKEKEVSFEGKFQGILPKSRSFEFCVKSEVCKVIKGKIGYDISDPGSLNLNFLYKDVKISLDEVTVGSGSPRYTLSSEDKIKLIEK